MSRRQTDWVTLRHQLRKEAGQFREELAKRQQYRCLYCEASVYTQQYLQLLGYTDIRVAKCGRVIRGRRYGFDIDFPYATVDHLRDISEGGTSLEANLVVACYACNQAKAERSRQVRRCRG